MHDVRHSTHCNGFRAKLRDLEVSMKCWQGGKTRGAVFFPCWNIAVLLQPPSWWGVVLVSSSLAREALLLANRRYEITMDENGQCSFKEQELDFAQL